MSFQQVYEQELLKKVQTNALLTNTILDYHDSEDPRKVELVFAGLHLLDLLCRKNQDYGCSVWTIPSLAPDCSAKTAIRVRLTDKFRRLENLLSREINLGDSPKVKESIDDTLLDIAGYCLLHLVCNDPVA